MVLPKQAALVMVVAVAFAGCGHRSGVTFSFENDPRVLRGVWDGTLTPEAGGPAVALRLEIQQATFVPSWNGPLQGSGAYTFRGTVRFGNDPPLALEGKGAPSGWPDQLVPQTPVTPGPPALMFQAEAKGATGQAGWSLFGISPTERVGRYQGYSGRSGGSVEVRFSIARSN